MKYLKVWTSFKDLIQTLNDDEIGRLFLMMLEYAETGEEPSEFLGNEAFLFPVAKQMINLASERNEKLRQNGLKGGRPKTKDNQTKPNETKENQSEAVKKRKEKERNEKESKLSSSFLDDDDARAIQNDHDRVLTAAEDAGFKMSDDVRAWLIGFYATYGLEKVLDGFKACVKHGAVNLAYLEAVLKGSPKKQSGRVLPAQDFEQRDYSHVQDEVLSEVARDIAEMRREVG